MVRKVATQGRTAGVSKSRQRCNDPTYGLAPQGYRDPIVTSFFPLQFLVTTFAGLTNRHQAQVIDYLVEENRVMKEQLGKKRLRLSDTQRRRLAVKGHALGRQALTQVASIVMPDTILRWS